MKQVKYAGLLFPLESKNARNKIRAHVKTMGYKSTDVSKNGRRWSEDEVTRLLDLVGHRAYVSKVAGILSRSPTSVLTRLNTVLLKNPELVYKVLEIRGALDKREANKGTPVPPTKSAPKVEVEDPQPKKPPTKEAVKEEGSTDLAREEHELAVKTALLDPKNLTPKYKELIEDMNQKGKTPLIAIALWAMGITAVGLLILTAWVMYLNSLT